MFFAAAVTIVREPQMRASAMGRVSGAEKERRVENDELAGKRVREGMNWRRRF